MEFEWDEQKNVSNKEKHGIFLTRAIEAFNDENRFVLTVHKPEEQRHKMFALVGQRVHVIIYTIRQENIRLISLRKANDREQRKYYGNRTR